MVLCSKNLDSLDTLCLLINMPSGKSCVLGLVVQGIPSRPVVQEDSFSFVTLRVITVLRRLIVKQASLSGGFCGTGFRWC